MTSRREQAGRRGLGPRKGFTLTELLVVLAIIGLAVSIMVPAMGPFLRSRRMTQAVESVQGAIARARYSAIMAGVCQYYVKLVSYDPDRLDAANKVEIRQAPGPGPIQTKTSASASAGSATISVLNARNVVVGAQIVIDGEGAHFVTNVADPVLTLSPALSTAVAANVAVQDVLSEEPCYLPDTTRLYVGSSEPYISFTPSGAAAGATNLRGAHVIGRVAFTGRVSAATDGAKGTPATAATLTMAGAAWDPDMWREHAALITTPGSPVYGCCRRIMSNTANVLTLAKPDDIEKGWVSWYAAGELPAVGDEFVIVTPDNARRIVVYSTTGRARVETPR